MFERLITISVDIPESPMQLRDYLKALNERFVEYDKKRMGSEARAVLMLANLVEQGLHRMEFNPYPPLTAMEKKDV